MAKNKSKPIEPEVIEEAVEEVTEEVVEEAIEDVAPEVAEPIEEKNDDAFIARTLKAINTMENPAKAKRLANRLLRKRR